MSNHIGLSDALADYVIRHSREGDIARRLRQETAAMPRGTMITTPDQANFLAFLVGLMQAKQVIEVGVFTGYATLAMAQALPEGGRVIACDVSHAYTGIGRRYWKEAGVEERIDLRIAPAAETLATLTQGQFDLIFIDADKGGYDNYYEQGLKLLRKGGLMAFDNMLWKGEVTNLDNHERDTVALRALNAKIAADKRVDASLLTVADGMMLVKKR